MTNNAIPAETLAIIKAHNLRPQQDVKFWYTNRAGERVQVKGRVLKLINGKAGPIVRLLLMEYEPGTTIRRQVNYLIANIEMPTAEETERRQQHQHATSCANGCDERGFIHRYDSSGIPGKVCRPCSRLPQYLLSYS
jgi:hypothetical protein